MARDKKDVIIGIVVVLAVALLFSFTEHAGSAMINTGLGLVK